MAEQQDKADDLVEDGLHLLMAALADGRQGHEPSVAILPVSCGNTGFGVQGSPKTIVLERYRHGRVCYKKFDEESWAAQL